MWHASGVFISELSRRGAHCAFISAISSCRHFVLLLMFGAFSFYSSTDGRQSCFCGRPRRFFPVMPPTPFCVLHTRPIAIHHGDARRGFPTACAQPRGRERWSSQCFRGGRPTEYHSWSCVVARQGARMRPIKCTRGVLDHFGQVDLPSGADISKCDPHRSNRRPGGGCKLSSSQCVAVWACRPGAFSSIRSCIVPTESVTTRY